nr:MAG TPA: hypothetical protein [Caudoviricetes sp.]DAW48139.1 MAG TPA: hypothetical protein [Caudoviricetes sp.]
MRRNIIYRCLLIAQSFRLSHFGTKGSKGFPAYHRV